LAYFLACRSRQFFSGFLDFKTGGFCSRISNKVFAYL